MPGEVQIDALPPAKMAQKMEDVGVTKSKLDFWTMFALAALAGLFVSCGAIFATTAVAGLAKAGVAYGIQKILAGLAFCLGLISVVVGGAELFTGNTLMSIALAGRKIRLPAMLRNWTVVYLGNFAGSLLTAGIVFLGQQYTQGSGQVGLAALSTANAKCALAFVPALSLGIMANVLVCLGVWLCASARTTTDRILACIWPVAAFVAAGFEHSVANMYFVPIGLFIKNHVPADAAFWTNIGKTAADFPSLTWGNFLVANLVPVTIGNIIGGSVVIGLAYWFAYLRPRKQ